MTMFVPLLVASSGQLCAYTDPGSGILLWQIAIAGFAGIAFKFRAIWGKLFKK
jgi:hypothetical protein